MMTTRLLVFGGKGALGSKCVEIFKSLNWWVLSVDMTENRLADASVEVPDLDSLQQQHELVMDKTSRIVGEDHLDAVLCLAGGWQGGNASSDNYIKSCASMEKSSVWTAHISASIASKFLKPGGLLVFCGSQAALEPTPGMIGYGIAKASVHALTKSLAAPKSGLPENSCVLAILPSTLDTPANRSGMPGADFTSWTPLEDVARYFVQWISGEGVPRSGSLVGLYTSASVTEIRLL